MGLVAPQENLLHRDTHDNAPARLRDLHARNFRGVDGMLDLEFYARPPRYFVGKRLDELLGPRWEKLLGKPRQYVTLLLTDAVQGPSPEIDYRYARRLMDLTERAAEEIERRGGLLPEIIQTYLELLEQYEANETLTRDGLRAADPRRRQCADPCAGRGRWRVGGRPPLPLPPQFQQLTVRAGSGLVLHRFSIASTSWCSRR